MSASLRGRVWLAPKSKRNVSLGEGEIFTLGEEKCAFGREIFDYVKEKYDLWSEKYWLRQEKCLNEVLWSEGFRIIRGVWFNYSTCSSRCGL